MTILDRVNAYVEAAKEAPMVWGESDCSTWPCGWVQGVHGRRIRLPVWHSRDEALSLIAEAGSLAALWDFALDDYGLFQQHHAPQPGDVGIIRTHIAGQVGGIFLNHGLFAWRATPSGVRVLLPRERTIVKVWAL